MVESKAAFARRKGWNRSTATRYAKDGKLVLDEHGMVDVEASEARLAASKDPMKEGVRQRHAQQRRGRDRARGGESDTTRIDPNDTTYQALTKHRAEGEKLKNELLELELGEKEGRLVDAEAVRKCALALAHRAGEAVMSLRFRLDPLLKAEPDDAKRAELWDRETRAIREEMARGAEAMNLEAAAKA